MIYLDKNIRLPLAIYSEHFEDLNKIKFTPREIDVIACVLNGRSAKTIPSLLSISAKTVATHLANIRAKTGCPSRESIIDFIEKSGKLSLIKHDYYLSLLTQVFFENQIKGISKSENHISIAHGPDINTQKPLLDKLKYHLELAGFKTKCLVEQELKDAAILQTTADGTEVQFPIDILSSDNYYATFFSMLKQLLPQNDIDKMVNDFKAYSAGIESHSSMESASDQPVFQEGTRRPVIAGLALLCCLLIFAGLMWAKPASQNSSLRSDLILPSDLTLVDRSDLISQINHAFKQQKGIASVAIVGIGGAGKTTLVRNYGKALQNKIVWEVNAETQESLQRSFEDLAYALANNDDDKNELREIQEIQIPNQKQERIIAFVRDRLRACQDWLLIYDNVETYRDIEKYFPHDTALWGVGRVLITTRNSTILNNSPISSLVQIGELTRGQKLELFSQIMQQGASNQLNEADAQKLLAEIPPFPLDVSIAAYYIRSTNIPYEKYLAHLNADEEGFSGLQEEILRESGGYNKTRYKIIVLALNKLISENEEFRDLFVLTSLLNSQNIPKKLLDRYKGDQVVENFIYSIKKYSLISEGTLSTPALPTFSIHRSTQKIILDYLAPGTKSEEINAIGKTIGDFSSEVIGEENIPEAKGIISHCEKFLEHSNLVTGENWVLVGKELGWIYFYVGNYSKSIETLERCQTIISKNSQYDHTLLSTYVKHYLGVAYAEMHECEKAEKLLNESLVLYKGLNGDNHDSVANNLAHLGMVALYKGKYESAKELFGQSYHILSTYYPDDSLSIARVMTRLGDANRELGNYAEAIRILEEGLAIYRKIIPADHYRIGQTLVRLGLVYRDIGDYQKARQLLQEGLTIYKKHFPSNCDKVAWVAGKLGQMENVLGNTNSARDLLENSLNIYKTHYSHDFELSWIKSYLGKVYSDLGLYEEAKVLLEESLQGNENNYGIGHKDTAQILRDLGELYCLQGNQIEGEQLIERSLNIYQAADHPLACMILETLGELYFKKSKQAKTPEEAQALKNASFSYYSQALAIIENRFPEACLHHERIQSAIKKLEQ